MKIRIHFKDPDALQEAIDTALEAKPANLSQTEWEAVKEIRREEISEIADTWFEYGEYLTVELDTEAKTLKVISSDEKNQEEESVDDDQF